MSITDHRRLETVKVLALASMLADHVGVLLDGSDWLRLVGRFALPAFLFVLAARLSLGGNVERVCVRLAAWAVVAQVPYTVFVGSDHINVLGTLAAGVALWSMRPAAVLAALATTPFVEYPVAVLALPVLVAFLRSGRTIQAGVALLVIAPTANFQWHPLFPTMAAIFASVVAFVPLPGIGRFRPGWAFYAFYPVHIAALGLIGDVDLSV